MFRILKYLKKQEWLKICASFVFIVAQVWLDLKLPDYMSEITSLVQTNGSEMKDILIAGLYMLLCCLGSLLSSIIVGYFAAHIAASLSKRVRELLYDRVEEFSMQEINQFTTASLITRSSNDITQVQMFIAMGLQLLIKAPILAIWAVVKIAGKNWQWTLATGIAVFVLVIIIMVLVVVALPKFKRIQGLTDNLNRVTRENLTGIRVIRAYNAELYQEEKFEKANNDLTSVNLFTNRMMAIMMPGMTLIMNGLSLAVYWVGAYLIDGAMMDKKLGLFSDMVVFTSYSMQIVMAFMMLTMIFIIFPRASVAAKRILEVLDTKPSILDGGYSDATVSEGEIEFKNVSFKYPDASDYALDNISFVAHKGETIAFIGATGSGKSTLINLIPRFYDVTEGTVLIDGIDAKEYNLDTLHGKIGYVSQKAVLFGGTVESNVGYGDNGRKSYTKDNIKKALEIAQAKEFVENMDGQYEAMIAQGGTNISGGQKQRISIARAICRNPEIYIFDDSFSALDFKTDKQLRDILKKEMKGITNLIVAQRIGTIKDADKIIVLQDGKIVGLGKHKELLKSCKVYQEIAYSQLSKEELAYE